MILAGALQWPKRGVGNRVDGRYRRPTGLLDATDLRLPTVQRSVQALPAVVASPAQF